MEGVLAPLAFVTDRVLRGLMTRQSLVHRLQSHVRHREENLDLSRFLTDFERFLIVVLQPLEGRR